MRRFSLHRPVRTFYAQIGDPKSGTFLSARSTGAADRDEAVFVVSNWLKDGLPEPKSGRRRSIAEVFDVDAVLMTIRSGNLTKDDATRIVDALQNQGFIEGATLASEDSETLLLFLSRFWNYGESPYVREKHAYGHSIGRRHCYEQTSHPRHRREYFGKETRLQEVSHPRPSTTS